MDEATKTEDLYGRHEQKSTKWAEASSVTGRAADAPPANSTLASRRAARVAPAAKRVDPAEVEDKAVASAATKAPAKRAAGRKRSTPKA